MACERRSVSQRMLWGTPLLVFLVSCGTGSSDREAKLEKALAEQSSKIENLEKSYNSLFELVRTEESMYLDQFANVAHESAKFDPSSDAGFLRLSSNVGDFIVFVEKIEPYGNGTKATFGVGNITSATFDGGTLSVRWGTKAPDKNSNEHSAWYSSLATVDSPFSETLRPGSWTRVSLLLSGTKPDKLGYVELSLKTDRISLKQEP